MDNGCCGNRESETSRSCCPIANSGVGKSLLLALLAFGLGFLVARETILLPEIQAPNAESIARAGAAGQSSLDKEPCSEESKPEPVSTRPASDFVRLSVGQNGEPLSLDTAIANYSSKNDPELSVALVGAVHVADDDYYQRLNEELQGYDAVLYELVIPTDQDIPTERLAKRRLEELATDNQEESAALKEDQKTLAVLSKFQHLISDILGFKHQLSEVDYTRSNFVHADLSLDKLFELGRERGETALTFALGVFTDMLRLSERLKSQEGESQGMSEYQRLSKSTLPELLNDPRKIKLLMAYSLSEDSALDITAVLATAAPYIIEARNAAVIKALRAELAKGHKKIAIFYGAAHLPDFDQRLKQEFKLLPGETRWLKAWDLTKQLKPRTLMEIIMRLL